MWVFHLQIAQNMRHGIRIGRIYAGSEYCERHRAIHSARIDVQIAQFLGYHFRNATLAGAGRAVNGNGDAF